MRSVQFRIEKKCLICDRTTMMYPRQVFCRKCVASNGKLSIIKSHEDGNKHEWKILYDPDQLWSSNTRLGDEDIRNGLLFSNFADGTILDNGVRRFKASKVEGIMALIDIGRTT